MENYNTQDDIITFIGIVFLLFITVFILLAIYLNVIHPFIEERNYIKMEMQRSFDEDEYQYWKWRLKQLYLKSIPVIGRFFR